MSRWLEIIEDESRRLSASRVNMMIGVITGSLVVLYLAWADNIGEGIFGIYMLATGGVYGFGKWQDSNVKREEIKATAAVNDVSMDVKGDVNVEGKS